MKSVGKIVEVKLREKDWTMSQEVVWAATA
jgi:hypothetical protein